MTNAYARTAEQRAGDPEHARKFEQEVRGVLPVGTFDCSRHGDKPDFYIPALGVYLEVKEKIRPHLQAWMDLRPDVLRENLFTLDELTVRRAVMQRAPVYFLIRDNPMDRQFLASAAHIVSVGRALTNRPMGKAGHLKGKWLIDLTELPELHRLYELTLAIQGDLTAQTWEKTPCVSLRVPTIGENQ